MCIALTNLKFSAYRSFVRTPCCHTCISQYDMTLSICAHKVSHQHNIAAPLDGLTTCCNQAFLPALLEHSLTRTSNTGTSMCFKGWCWGLSENCRVCVFFFFNFYAVALRLSISGLGRSWIYASLSALCIFKR